MIIKEKSIKSDIGLERAFRYVLEKTNDNVGFLLRRFITGDRPLEAMMEVLENDMEEISIIMEKRIQNMLNQFYQNDKKREIKRKNAVKYYHSILSFHKSDQLTEKQLLMTARKYAKERFPKSLSVFVPHFDKEHLHLHGLASAVERSTGKTHRLTRKEFKGVKERMELWQDKTLGLQHSRVNHSKKKDQALLKDAEYQIRLKGKLSEKQKINLVLSEILGKSSSEKAFYKTLEKSGLETYMRNGRMVGIKGNRKYRLKTLGFSDERLKALEQQNKRLKSLERLKLKNDKELKL